MLLHPVHTLCPDLTVTLCAAELPGKDEVEGLHFLFSPFDAGAHHGGRKTALKAFDRVVNDHEVDKRELPDV